jgi:Asp-tRNA(Asn)/Glu-tRNA(Gln) amidotransferase A subunit family amidase
VQTRGLKVGLCRTPVWEQADPASRDTLFAAATRLEAAGAEVSELELPASFAGLPEAQKLVMNGEGRVSFLPEYLGAYDLLAPDLRAKVENAMGITPEMMAASYALADSCRPQFDALFGDELDVILSPAARGEAPLGLHSTGDAIFSGLWTLLHVPSVAIPAGRGPQNLPVGIQILGPRFADARLLSIAAAIAPVIDIEMHTPLADTKRLDARQPDAKPRVVERISGSASR